MKPEKILAWHFTDGMKLRDGRELVAGKAYRHKGKLWPCESGLHASVRPFDALRYAPGLTRNCIVSRVECSGEIVKHGDPVDKFVCRERKVLWCADAGETLRAFSRRCASDVLHLWAAPDIVKEYLATGDESKREPALKAAYAANAAAHADAAYAANAAANAAAHADAAYAANAAAYAAYAAYAAAYAASVAWKKKHAESIARYNAWLEEALMSLKPKKKARKKGKHNAK